jgi:hypothetical protein
MVQIEGKTSGEKSIWTDDGKEQTLEYNHIPAEQAGRLATELINEGYTVQINESVSERDLEETGYQDET